MCREHTGKNCMMAFLNMHRKHYPGPGCGHCSVVKLYAINLWKRQLEHNCLSVRQTEININVTGRKKIPPGIVAVIKGNKAKASINYSSLLSLNIF